MRGTLGCGKRAFQPVDYALNVDILETDMNRDQSFLSGAKLWLIASIVGGLVVVAYFMSGSSKEEAPTTSAEPQEVIESEVPATSEPEDQALTLPPAPEPEAPKAQPEVVVSLPPEQPPKPVAPGLPLLEGSDPELYRELSGTVRDPEAAGLKGLLVPKDRIRRFVTTVKNLSENKVPRRHLPVVSAAGNFAVAREADGSLVVDKANFRRYTPYVELLEAVDAAKLAAAYRHLAPLFDQAYRELGFPKASFKSPLLAAIDRVLAAPKRKGDLVVKRQSVNYVFADPEIEALPELDKLMLRMGPDNAARIKARLRVLRTELLNIGGQ